MSVADVFISPDGRLRSGWRLLIALFCVVAGSFLGLLIAKPLGQWPAWFQIVYRGATSAVVWLLFWLCAKKLDAVPDAARHIGLSPRLPWLRDLVLGTSCGAVLVSACVGGIALFGGYEVGLAPEGKVSRGLALAIVAAIFIVGGIMEELFFRSYAFFRMIESFTNLVRSIPNKVELSRAQMIGSWAALLLINGLFGAAHLQNPNATFWGFANTVLIGIFFGVVMLRTGSLWLLWGIHFGWNFTLGGLYGLPVSGFNLFSVWTRGKLSGPLWLTGGDYGIEASAVATFGISLVLVAVLILRRPATSDLISGIQPE
jgi:uncharacterized protein